MNFNQDLDILDKIIKYSEQPVHFTYGVDELLNLLNVFDLDILKHNLSVPNQKRLSNAIQKVKLKRIRFLRSQLASPDLKPHQVAAIKMALDSEDTKPQQRIQIELMSNIINNTGDDNDN